MLQDLTFVCNYYKMIYASSGVDQFDGVLAKSVRTSEGIRIHFFSEPDFQLRCLYILSNNFSGLFSTSGLSWQATTIK